MKIHEVAILIAAVLAIVAANIVIVFRAQIDVANQRPNQSVTSLAAPSDYEFDWGDCDIDAFDIIRNGTIYDQGEVIKQNGQVVDISGGDPKPEKSYNIKGAQYKTRPLGVLLHSHDSTYYHALIQFGSRFQYIVEHCKNSGVTWVIRASPTQKKILELLNQPPVLNLTVYKPSKHPSSQLVLVPPAPYSPQDLVAFRMALMRRALPPRSFRFVDKPPRAQTTVFVRRVRRRAIKNEADVLRPIHEAFPHRLVYFHERDDVPFASTIATFQAAAQVLGGHGAGLANIIFCRPGARVFEIRRNGTPSEFASELAPVFRLRLHRYVDPRLLSHRPELHYSNYTVNAAAWRAFVRKAAGLPAEPAGPDPAPAKKDKSSSGKSKGPSAKAGRDGKPAPPAAASPKAGKGEPAGPDGGGPGEKGAAAKGFWG